MWGGISGPCYKTRVISKSLKSHIRWLENGRVNTKEETDASVGRSNECHFEVLRVSSN